MTTKPLAVGIVRHDAAASELVASQARVALARYAQSAGYALVETYDLSGDAQHDAGALAALAASLRADDIAAAITLGPVQLPDLLGAVDVLPVPPDAHPLAH